MLLAGIQIMIHAINAASLKALGMFVGQQSQARADLQVITLLNLRHERLDGVHLTLVGSASGYHDAVGPRLTLSSDARTIEQLVATENVVARNFRLRDFR